MEPEASLGTFSMHQGARTMSGIPSITYISADNDG